MKSRDGKNNYYNNLDKSQDELILIKACDKLDNIFAQCLHKDKNQRNEYFLEIEEFILPRLSNKFLNLRTTLDKVIKEMICIPCGWWVTDEQREYIVDCIKRGW